jgi:thiol-disulfide isomerase/thioredoxin
VNLAVTWKLGRNGRIALVVLAVLAVQLSAWWVYRHVERTRAGHEDVTELAYERIESDPQALDAPLQSSDGRTVTLRSLIGKPLLVHFWATWCGPCRTELPKLVQLGRELGVRVLLVSVDKGLASRSSLLRCRSTGRSRAGRGRGDRSALRGFDVAGHLPSRAKRAPDGAFSRPEGLVAREGSERARRTPHGSAPKMRVFQPEQA